MKILITGFNAFLGHSSNPSESLVQWLQANSNQLSPDVECEFVVLPVSYEQSFALVEALINTSKYKSILMFGLAAGIKHIHLERVALNWVESSSPDNDQRVKNNLKVDPVSEQKAFINLLPLEQWKDEMQSLNIPCKVSLSAGGYVCNHLYFKVSQKGLPCLFVHISEDIETHQGEPVINTLQRAAKFLIAKMTSF